MVEPPADASGLQLRISAHSGTVTLTAEHRGDVVVHRGGVASAPVEGTVDVRPGRASDSIDVSCPVGTDVVIGTRSGSVRLEGRFGTVGITSQSGRVHVATAAAADLRSVSGAVELQRCNGRCRVSTTSGRIAVGATDDAVISTTSGAVSIGDVAGAVEVRAVRASITITSAARGPIDVSTVSGSIVIHLPKDVRPAVRSTGRVKIDNGVEPGDDVDITIASVSGTVRIVPG